MVWTAPRTWVAGETVTAAIMNTHVRDNLKAIGDPWTAYVPTLTNFTVGNGTMSARYMQAGKMTHFYVSITFGSTSTWGTSWTVTLPSAILTSGEWRFYIGMRDFSAPAQYIGFGALTSGNTVTLTAGGGAAGIISTALTATAPFTWAVSDIVTLHGTYESA